jgi:Na+/H+-translocating membrane pyrophosphatase
LAAYGAVANNANRLVHLTTVNEMAHHRANVCATIGTTTSHNGKCIAGQNCFFATTALLGALLADKYTSLGQNWQSTVGQELSEWTRAGLLSAIVFTMLFLANTLTSCITMAKLITAHAKDNPDSVGPRLGKAFPASHIKPLMHLVSYASIECFRLTISPMVQTFGAPLVIGQLFGFKGLLMLVSGGNSVAFSLNMFLINAGQAWDAARKYILFGMLRNEKGDVLGAESEVYDTLGIGEQIGGPLEDLTGPALNNFIKFVALTAFVTSDLYDELPTNSWPMGFVQIAINFVLVSFFKWGLAITVREIERLLRERRERIEYEEGTVMLREIEAREKDIESKVAEKTGGFNEDEIALY